MLYYVGGGINLGPEDPLASCSYCCSCLTQMLHGIVFILCLYVATMLITRDIVDLIIEMDQISYEILICSKILIILIIYYSIRRKYI